MLTHQEGSAAAKTSRRARQPERWRPGRAHARAGQPSSQHGQARPCADAPASAEASTKSCRPRRRTPGGTSSGLPAGHS